MILGDYSSWRNWLVRSFVWLGPLGSLLTPHFLPKPFRFYYLLLPLFPLFFIKIKKEQAQLGLVFFPFFLYSFLSVAFSEILKNTLENDQLFKFFLLFCQFYFVLGASSQISHVEEQKHLVTIYLRSFFAVLLVGYVFFIGYHLHWLSLFWVERFSVLTQFAYDVLRFSPGSYPNEFGIVSSFVLSTLILLIFAKEPLKDWGLSPIKLFFFIPLTFGALFLTTTRAAYFSFGACFFYLFFRYSEKIKYLFLIGLLSFFFFLQSFGFSSLIWKSLFQRIDEGSWGERYFAWLQAFQLFQHSPFLGVGFSAFSQLHNVYLSLLFELGLLGNLILTATLISRFLLFPSFPHPPTLHQIKKLGLIHVLWFAASNHNLHHHLTWFIFLLCFASLRKELQVLNLGAPPLKPR